MEDTHMTPIQHAYEKVLEQCIQEAERIVVSQVRYYIPDRELYEEEVDKVTDEQTLTLLKGKAILNRDNLVVLIAKMEVGVLMSHDAWAEPVAEYIADHSADSEAVWEVVRSLR